MPPNQIEVKLKFPRRRSAKVMGSLADRATEPVQGENVRGILVTHNFHSKIVSPRDLSTYTPLRVGTIKSKLHVPFMGSINTLRLFLTEMFANVTEEVLASEGEVDIMIPMEFRLHGGQVRFLGASDRRSVPAYFDLTTLLLWCLSQISIKTGVKKGVATVEWLASPAGDVIADSVVALLMHAQSSSASIRLSSKPCRHPSDAGLLDDQNNKSSKKPRDDNDTSIDGIVESRLRFVYGLLKDQFRQVEAVYERNIASFEVVTDSGLESNIVADDDGKLRCNVKVEVDENTGDNAIISIECQDQKLAANIQKTIKNALSAFDKI